MNEVALVDTGFWIALFDAQKPEQHKQANRNADLVEAHPLLVPWPILYETLRTRFVHRRDWVVGLETRLKKPDVVFLDDQKYRSEARSQAVDYAVRLKRPISMVDMLCRLLIEDPNVHFKYILTTNPKDFSDLCRKHRIEMIL